MKKMHLIGIVLIAISVAALAMVAGDMSTTATFEKANMQPGQSFKITGHLVKEKDLEYNPEKDPNYFSFHMKDEKGEIRKVIMNSAKPQDFERSEEIVVTGYMENENFISTNMLLKCPSKYKDEEIQIKANL